VDHRRGGKQQVEREFDASYVNGLVRSDTWTWSLHTNFDRSGTPRFYGLGNHSPMSAQTNYVDNQGHVEATAGWNITQQWQVSYTLRLGFVQIGAAVLPSLPSIDTRFPQLPGLDREEELQQRMILTYDTRDSITIRARRGDIRRSRLFELGHLGLGVVFVPRTEARYIGRSNPWLTVAAHAALRYMPWATGPRSGAVEHRRRPQRGGERQPFAAFGGRPFIDRDSFAAGASCARAWSNSKVFATNLSIELAPFIDLGKVFSRDGENPWCIYTKWRPRRPRRGEPFHRRLCRCRIRPEGLAVFTGSTIRSDAPRIEWLERSRARPDERTRALTVMHRGGSKPSRIKSLLTNSQQKTHAISPTWHIRGFYIRPMTHILRCSERAQSDRSRGRRPSGCSPLPWPPTSHRRRWVKTARTVKRTSPLRAQRSSRHRRVYRCRTAASGRHTGA